MDKGGEKTDIGFTNLDPFHSAARQKRCEMEKQGYVKEPIFYGFTIGKRFTIDVLPPKDGDVVFSVVSVDNDPPIEIGYIEKTHESIIQDIKLKVF
jgi:hypothetical protein